MTNRTCIICGMELTGRARKLCGAETCKKRNDANWQLAFQRKHREEHGQYYSRKYQEDIELKAKRDRLRNLETPVRKRYPAQFAAKDARRRMRKIETAGEVINFNPLPIFEANNWVCQLCSEKVDPELAYPNPRSKSLDHIIPLAKGGSHTPANAQLAHLACNMTKGAKSGAELQRNERHSEVIGA